MKHKRKIHQKTNYATELMYKKAQQRVDDHQAGFDFACYLITVGLNELFGFGYDRLRKLEDWLNDAIDNEFSKDREVAAYALKRRVEQIMKRGGADGRCEVD